MKNMTSTRVEKKMATASPTQATASETKDDSAAMPSEDTIRALAYEKWQAAGCPEGDGVEFWLSAEKDITEQDGRQLQG